MTEKRRYVLVWVFLALAGLGLRGAFMNTKTTWHVDEAISLSIVNDNWPNKKDTSYLNRWLPMKELSAIVFDNTLKTAPMGELLANTSLQTGYDVHPPLYYWLLALTRKAVGPTSHSLAVFVLNGFLFLVSVYLCVLIAKKLRFSPLMTTAVLLCLAFAKGSVSSTIFARMYELLQVWVLLFAYSVLCIVHEDARKGVRVILPFLLLFLSVYEGLLTHYYMLFVILPVSLTALVLLAKKKRPDVIMWSLLIVIAALTLAMRTFPQMGMHLFGSYRAGESAQTLAGANLAERLRRLGAFVSIISSDFFPLVIAVLVIVVGAVVSRFRKAASAPWLPAAGAAVFTVASLFSVSIVALSSPYQTGRYVAALLPLIIFSIASLLTVFAQGELVVKSGVKRFSQPIPAVLMLALAVSIVLGTVIDPKINEFHEDYVLDAKPEYLSDDLPVLLLSTTDAWSWKNMLIYKNISLDKNIYVTDAAGGKVVNTIIYDLAAETGVKSMYVILDTFFSRRPTLERVGFYGFFEVYKFEAK